MLANPQQAWGHAPSDNGAAYGTDASMLRIALLRQRTDAANAKLAAAEHATSDLATRGAKISQMQLHELAEVRGELARTMLEEREALLRGNSELVASRAAGDELSQWLAEGKVFGAPDVRTGTSAPAGSAKVPTQVDDDLWFEEATLRTAMNGEMAAERELEDRLMHVERQLRARARASSPSLGGGAGACNGADAPQARVRAKNLHIEALSLKKAWSESEARTEKLKYFLSSASVDNLGERLAQETETEGRTAVVRQALSDLKQLHAAMGQRYVELESLIELREARGPPASVRSELESMQEELSMSRTEAECLRIETNELACEERAAQQGELRLLAAAHSGDAELRKLRAELAQSEDRGAKLALLVERGYQ